MGIKMVNLVSKQAPNFTAKAVSADNNIVDLELHDYIKGKNCVLFFYPLDFTFVCPSEILAFNEKLSEFEKRNTKVIAISIDSEYTHLAYKNTPVEEGGIGQVQFPMVADITKQIARDYDVLMGNAVAFRGLFIIDSKGAVRHQLINDLPLGRSVDEAIRVVDSILHHEQHGEVCPANWNPGKDAMKPSAEGLQAYMKKFKAGS